MRVERFNIHAIDRNFAHINFDFTTLEHRLRELAFLNSGVRIRISDERKRDGAMSVVLMAGYLPLLIIWTGHEMRFIQQLPLKVNVMILPSNWPSPGPTLSRKHIAFTNNIPQRDGGPIWLGFAGWWLASWIITPAKRHCQKGKGTAGEDSREANLGVSVKVPDPKFSSQTKDKLVSLKYALLWKRRLLIVWHSGLKNIQLMPALCQKLMKGLLPVRQPKGTRFDAAERSYGYCQPTGQASRLSGTRSGKIWSFPCRGACWWAAKQGRDRANQAILPLVVKFQRRCATW